MPGPVHRFFFRLLDLVSYARYRFLPSGPFRRKGLPSLPSRPDLLLVTVAFNRADMIDRQLEMVRQQVKEENCCHLVVDNSPDPHKRKAIREVCRRHGAAYAAVPHGVFPFLARRFTLCSMSHAFALNWAYYRIVRRVRPKFFALLDHDIFPISPCRMADLPDFLDIYGVRRTRGNGSLWYLWPGWTVFRFSAVDPLHPDFCPTFQGKVYLDTGGGNYRRICRRIDPSRVRFAPDRFFRLSDDESISQEDLYYGWCVEGVDRAWLHLINGSDYKGLGTKEEMLQYCMEHLPIFRGLLRK